MGETTLTDNELLTTLAVYRDGRQKVGPPLDWIAARLGLSGKASVSNRLSRLEERGWLRRTAPKHHNGGYQITPEGKAALAGFADPQDTFSIDRSNEGIYEIEEAQRDEHEARYG